MVISLTRKNNFFGDLYMKKKVNSKQIPKPTLFHFVHLAKVMIGTITPFVISEYHKNITIHMYTALVNEATCIHCTKYSITTH